MLKTFIIIIAVIAIGVLSINIYFSFKENKAVQVAQEYLAQKYDQTMRYESAYYSWVEPSKYQIKFSPADNPEIIFEVIVYDDLTLPGGKGKVGQSDWNADNYYVKHFEYCMEEYLIPEVKRLWDDDATVGVLDVDNVVGGVTFSISPELNDKMALTEMEPLIKDYGIYIDVGATTLDKRSLKTAASQFFEFINVIKENRFKPKTIYFGSSNEGNEEGVLFKDWDEIDSLDQVIDIINEQWRFEN